MTNRTKGQITVDGQVFEYVQDWAKYSLLKTVFKEVYISQ